MLKPCTTVRPPPTQIGYTMCLVCAAAISNHKLPEGGNARCRKVQMPQYSCVVNFHHNIMHTTLCKQIQCSHAGVCSLLPPSLPPPPLRSLPPSPPPLPLSPSFPSPLPPPSPPPSLKISPADFLYGRLGNIKPRACMLCT